MPANRSILVSLFAGLLHAAVLLVAALHLGYSVAPSDYSVLGMGWRYGGLVVVAAVPVWLAVRHRIVAPLVALALTTGYVLGMELTPPGPTFRDVAELERLDEPTGVTVVENGLYIVRYMVNASVWTVGFLFLGAIEYAVRTIWDRLPSVSAPISRVSLPAPRPQAAVVAAAGGLLHAVVMLWFSLRLGLTVSGEFGWLLYAVSTAGMWILAAVPLYLLVRHRLVPRPRCSPRSSCSTFERSSPRPSTIPTRCTSARGSSISPFCSWPPGSNTVSAAWTRFDARDR